jgi:hypothetical protein
MTLGELLQIGDEVVFKVDPETRHWTNTYKDVPDGTKGVVCRIRDTILYYGRTNVFVRAPGVYHTKGGATVLLKTDPTIIHPNPLNHPRSIIKEIPMILHHQIIKKEEISTSIDPKDSVKIVYMSKIFQNTITKSKS